MRKRGEKDHPSPVLAHDHVRDLLVERNGEVGAAGGAIGGAAGGGVPGSRGGASGGRTGGRLGARLFTRVTGLSRSLAVPCTDDAVARARDVAAPLLDEAALPRRDVASPLVLVGMVGAGAMGMNSAVVQLVWHPGRLDVTAHALEGIIDQRTASGAIDKLEEALTPFLRTG
ncbi:MULTISPECIES: hypothetical protein [Prauserella salsuginis group]|uniref:Uncharacterized protein n=2 Tax=Prauserella salsuginis group TaxID=2893672 RepID=A0A839XKG0_9PSEU|nr:MULTISPECIES: hypothetical protein [Prauserella salsuginis group]MBB3663770.1 hypothetical protein [Prauserella sediminis]MCR3722450.1 hypothetical protein [Prauserella flava]MCR3736892.1 hypothetical protein [Prauserella salsuginis]